MRAVLDDDPTRMVLILSMLWGVSNALNTAVLNSHGDLFTAPLIMALAGIFGPSAGITMLYLLGAYLAWVGRLLGGKGTARELRAAFAWSSIPNIVSLLLLFPALFLFGNDLFTTDTPYIGAHPSLVFLLGTYIFVDVILSVWAVTMFVKCVAEAHRFSSWRALLTMFSWFVFLGAVILVGYLVSK